MNAFSSALGVDHAMRNLLLTPNHLESLLKYASKAEEHMDKFVPEEEYKNFGFKPSGFSPS